MTSVLEGGAGATVLIGKDPMEVCVVTGTTATMVMGSARGRTVTRRALSTRQTQREVLLPRDRLSRLSSLSLMKGSLECSPGVQKQPITSPNTT